MPIDEDSEATIYLSWQADGVRKTICLHTNDLHEAERKQANIMGRIRWESHTAYLEALVALGDEARKELNVITERHTDIALADVWEAYLKSKRRPSTAAVTLNQYRLEWSAFKDWCEVTGMREVTAAMAELYVAKRDEDVSARTVNAQLTTLRRIWATLQPDAPNPWTGLRSTQTGQVIPYRPLTLKECRLVFSRATEETVLLIALGYYTAQRLKDAVLMRGEYVDLKAGLITMPPPAKTRRRKRSPLRIPILPELAKLLTAVPRKGPVMPTLAAAYEADRGAITRKLTPIFKGLPTTNGRASFHSFRATFITNMDLAGCPQRLTDQITNHAPATVRAGYSQPDSELARDYMVKALSPLGKRREAKPRRKANPRRKATPADTTPAGEMSRTVKRTP